jgi:hypothetical protein
MTCSRCGRSDLILVERDGKMVCRRCNDEMWLSRTGADGKSTLDKGHLDEVEHDIAPPMKASITIPVMLDGKRTGIAVYVAEMPAADLLGLPAGKKLLQKIAQGLTLNKE